jgi:hypothetical protein
MPNPSYFTLLPTIGTALLIVFTADSSSSNITSRVLSLKPFVWLGLISYSAYLIHQPLFVFYRLRFLNGLDSSLVCLGLIALVIVMSFASWTFIENPFRKRDGISISAVFVSVFVYLIVVRLDFITVVLQKDLVFQSAEGHHPQIFKNSSHQISQPFLVKNSSNTTTGNFSDDFVFTEMPSQDQFHYGELTTVGRRCFWDLINAPKNTQPPVCPICQDSATNSSPPVYFLFGDSLATVMTNIFNEFQPPGMFLAFHAAYCIPLLRSDMNVTKIRPDFPGYNHIKFLIIRTF